MSNLKANIFSFLIAPLSLIPLGVIMLVGSFAYSGQISFDDVWVVSGIIGTGIIISYLALLVFGVPISVSLQYLDNFKYRFLLLLSLIPSAVVLTIFRFENTILISMLIASGLFVSSSYKAIYDWSFTRL